MGLGLAASRSSRERAPTTTHSSASSHRHEDAGRAAGREAGREVAPVRARAAASAEAVIDCPKVSTRCKGGPAVCVYGTGPPVYTWPFTGGASPCAASATTTFCMTSQAEVSASPVWLGLGLGLGSGLGLGITSQAEVSGLPVAGAPEAGARTKQVQCTPPRPTPPGASCPAPLTPTPPPRTMLLLREARRASSRVVRTIEEKHKQQLPHNRCCRCQGQQGTLWTTGTYISGPRPPESSDLVASR